MAVPVENPKNVKCLFLLPKHWNDLPFHYPPLERHWNAERSTGTTRNALRVSILKTLDKHWNAYRSVP
jgi:hypothetical protein